jgi:hypothetical protein
VKAYRNTKPFASMQRAIAAWLLLPTQLLHSESALSLDPADTPSRFQDGGEEHALKVMTAATTARVISVIFDLNIVNTYCYNKVL